jgi:TonB family protein
MARLTKPAGADGRLRLVLGGLLLGLCLWPLPGRASEIDHIMAGATTVLAGLLGLATGLAALLVLVVVLSTPAEKRRSGPVWLAGLALVSVLCLSRAGLLKGITSGWGQPDEGVPPFGLVLPNRRPVLSSAILSEMARVNSADTTQPAQVYTFVEVMPHLAGGDSAASRLVRQTMRYPAAARQRRAKGMVYVSFLVGTRGEVRNSHVVKHMDYGCDEEALRVLAALPAFVPGMQGGRPVVVQVLWAFSFCPPEGPAPRQ